MKKAPDIADPISEYCAQNKPDLPKSPSVSLTNLAYHCHSLKYSKRTFNEL